ncbi:MAG: hypothetical protein K6C30_08715 [Bacteroidaceae bacterium]|nr:hypothetical protein [Bacteroidaceae bacterium]
MKNVVQNKLHTTWIFVERAIGGYQRGGEWDGLARRGRVIAADRPRRTQPTQGRGEGIGDLDLRSRRYISWREKIYILRVEDLYLIAIRFISKERKIYILGEKRGKKTYIRVSKKVYTCRRRCRYVWAKM